MPTLPTPARTSAEAVARACLSEHAGRELSDEEWTAYKARLLAYLQLLRSWERAEKAVAFERPLG